MVDLPPAGGRADGTVLVIPDLPGSRRYVYTLCLLAACTACLVLLQAELLAGLLTGSVTLALPIAALAGRALLLWVQESVAARFAASAKEHLRSRVLRSTMDSAGAQTTLVTRGIDAVGPYLTGYLPQMVLSATVPLAVLVRLCIADLTSALIIAGTLPLIPIFAILVGKHTKRQTERQWDLLSRLGGHFLDVVRGMETLILFKRAGAQARIVREMAVQHADATMKTLRVAFLSALVLELVATLSIALVAVPVGLRLLNGSVDLETALLVLLLAPEAYLPLRAAGTKFHAAAEGLTVLKNVLELKEKAPSVAVNTRPPDLRTARISLEGVTVRYPGREEPAIRDFWLTIEPGERVALIGPSGAGKSTVLSVVLGLTKPSEGRVRVGDIDLREIAGWHDCLTWVPQRPWLMAASVAENIRLADANATDVDIDRAAAAAVLDVSMDRPGRELSSGQRQRVALARALLRRSAPLVLLDEPTARLDTQTEQAVLAASRKLLAGKTALLVAHRPALLPETDRVVRVG
ncbi:thiol reductant ABC exporter subunit CydD [Kibdelosporangium philippinense]|uniref:Thiol reductant ABC exporter subunit CydD n=1 Tax=Kibdelosporangium philippinense TaxID=211113 RepID=A0ABS8ZPB2_9PSEU|nr:thiol reductant ABC exporter subunit CydD [Kibdelosporangium philippinense]MCE7008471.1 thiol reductant ABC exporter subunit CydD [Kibdelosporangium philippinense]